MKIYAAMSSGFVPAAHARLLEQAEQLTKHRLFSYHYHGATSPDNSPSKWVRIAKERDCTMFLDSGAFSAYHCDVSIDIDKYAAYINNTKGWWDVIANLDVIGGSEQQNWDNLKALESNGCNPCPVYHVGEDPKWLKKMLDNYEYILLGGLVMQRKTVLRELDRAFRVLCHPDGTARVDTHGFGLTQLDMVFRYPWTSVDSTSWMLSAGFGSCVLYDGTTQFQQIYFSDESPQAKLYQSRHYDRLSPPKQAAVDRLIAPTGISIDELRSGYPARRVLNLYSYQQLELMEEPRFTGAVLDLGLF